MFLGGTRWPTKEHCMHRLLRGQGNQECGPIRGYGAAGAAGCAVTAVGGRPQRSGL